MTVQDSQLTSSEPELELEIGGYRLRGTPDRREGGSLLFDALGPDGEPAALQVTAEPLTGRRTRARFRKLARVRAELQHPALLPVRSFGEERGRLYVVTDPRPAESLVDLVRAGPADPELALRLIASTADGLTAGHEVGLVHLALGAESLLLEGDRLQLDLFGVFRAAGQAGWGDVVRRDPHLRYESPEGVRGEQLSPASNVYSLTALLVHAITGSPPFAYKDPMLIEHAHLSEAPPRPSERHPGLPAALDEVVARGMAKDPAERPPRRGRSCRRRHERWAPAVRRARRPGRHRGWWPRRRAPSPFRPSPSGPSPYPLRPSPRRTRAPSRRGPPRPTRSPFPRAPPPVARAPSSTRGSPRPRQRRLLRPMRCRR